MKQRVLITGASGQCASYLMELLLEKDYEVYGMIRRSSIDKLDRIKHIEDKIKIVIGDLSDQHSLTRIIKTIKPHITFNLAAQSHVGISFEQPEYTCDVTGLGCLRVLEAIRESGFNSKFFQASTSEMFGNQMDNSLTSINESTPFFPRSPYGVSKVFAHQMTINYRESYNMFACCGIMFNNESPRRGENFVTRKITIGMSKIKKYLEDTGCKFVPENLKIKLGNIEAKRDWGYTKDFMEAVYTMMIQPIPQEYIIGTGETTSVKQFLFYVTKALNLSTENLLDYYIIDPLFYRPSDINCLNADSSKAKKELRWSPKTNVRELAKIMVENDYERILVK